MTMALYLEVLKPEYMDCPVVCTDCYHRPPDLCRMQYHGEEPVRLERHLHQVAIGVEAIPFTE